MLDSSGGRRDGEMFGAGLPDFDQILQHLTQDPNMMVANHGETTIDSHAPNTNLLLNPWAACGGSYYYRVAAISLAMGHADCPSPLEVSNLNWRTLVDMKCTSVSNEWY
ncbi:hypothetical protein Tco_0701315 [Tanacetum coccineum]